jgi:predicted amidohydrolase YtcJ
MVIRNAKVVTVDEQFSIRQAVAVDQGRIVAVGSDGDIAAYIGPDTQVIDLKGKTILPGINDSHLHVPFFGSTRPPLSLDLTGGNVTSITAMADLLREKVAQSGKGEWIRGYGWDAGALAECKNDPKRLPRKGDIDAVSPDNPVLFTDFSAHVLLVNSKTLEMAGITKATPDPPSGIMERDPATGEPTGIFIELGAQALVSHCVPLLTRAEKKQAVQTALSHFAANGITSFTDAAIGPGGESYAYGVMSAEFIDIYRELLLEGNLTGRANVLLLLGDYGALTLDDMRNNMESVRIPTDVDDTWLKFTGIKIFADGIPPTMTSWMNEEYVGGGKGALVIAGQTDADKVKELTDMIAFAHSKGFQVGVHATGDQAIDVTVDAFVQACERYGNQDQRHYVVHGDYLSLQKMALMARHGFGLATQPSIKSLICDYVTAIVGEERAAWEFPIKSAMTSGVNVSSSSDAPVTYPNWRAGVQAAVTRKGAGSGKVSGPEQCISVADAIRTYTINAAWQDHMETVKGSIEVGKVADFCVLDQDILSADSDTIGRIGVVMTIAGGKIVFDAASQ